VGTRASYAPDSAVARKHASEEWMEERGSGEEGRSEARHEKGEGACRRARQPS